MKNKPQLFLFPFAGGTSGFFDIIKSDLKNVELVVVEYAGHGKRYGEAFYTCFDELVSDVYGILKQKLKEPYALFGYSMGSIVLVEVLKRILEDGIIPPTNIFIAAHEPHIKREMIQYESCDNDEKIKQRTVQFGGIPQNLVDNKTFWRVYLPVYRADYRLIDGYDFEKINLKCNIPATVFYSENDTPFEDIKLWEKYFPCVFFCFSGRHFFIREHHKEIGAIICEKMGGEYK